MIDHDSLIKLDATLEQFYSLLHHKANLNVVATNCEAILDGHVNILVRDDWRDAWENHKWLASGWFDSPGLTKAMADALHNLFSAMARFVLDFNVRGVHKKALKKVCSVYLKRRGLRVKVGRPPKPTRAYCLVQTNNIRWIGTVRVQSRHWHLLGCMLDAGGAAVPFSEIIYKAFGNKQVSDKRVSGVVCELNDHLVDIQFPSKLHTKSAQVYFNPPL